MEELWQSIYKKTSKIISNSSRQKEVYGRDLIDLPPDELIFFGTKLPYQNGTIELTLATSSAIPTFEWLAEITLKQPENVEHYLLRPDHTIVETYGKTVLDVNQDRARQLILRLTKIEQA
jgi:hypothetical protein